ncbi:MAG: 2-C-methyl-D-erythritol 2,4-cyclodiphosphate synthase [Clostridia bacterium]|nr:2-C-methyl-D-erythritol 2,4-cyclodiphosphate synthase [Clostridia bacterium]
MRIGTGYDVHQLVNDRPLILGGVEIPFEKGLLGHSDADVLVHAIMDAMLGALALGDIGTHFPDHDPEFKGISSIKLLKHVNDLILSQGYKIGNIDSVLICERPKLKSYILEMRTNIALALEVEVNQISVKATTTEKLGFTGRQEGIASQAVCLLLNHNVNS